jgi:hypothetical protein
MHSVLNTSFRNACIDALLKVNMESGVSMRTANSSGLGTRKCEEALDTDAGKKELIRKYMLNLN